MPATHPPDTERQEEPPSHTSPPQNTETANGKTGLIGWLKDSLRAKSGSEHLQEALEEYIEELEEQEGSSVAAHESSLIANVLKLRQMTAADAMIPRADIAALEVSAPREDIMALLAERQYSRIPVYNESLDNILGTIHIKDILACMAAGKDITPRTMVREVPVIAPSLPVLDLLLQMQQTKKHMALVVDEYGGIDGLVTIGDVIEAIVGEIDDEFDQDDQPRIVEMPDGTLLADARVYIEEFENRYGKLLSEEEREDIDTLGGLVFDIAGRVPARGEVLKHDSGMIFEIVDGDPRRISKVRIRNMPEKTNP